MTEGPSPAASLHSSPPLSIRFMSRCPSVCVSVPLLQLLRQARERFIKHVNIHEVKPGNIPHTASFTSNSCTMAFSSYPESPPPRNPAAQAVPRTHLHKIQAHPIIKAVAYRQRPPNVVSRFQCTPRAAASSAARTAPVAAKQQAERSAAICGV